MRCIIMTLALFSISVCSCKMRSPEGAKLAGTAPTSEEKGRKLPAAATFADLSDQDKKVLRKDFPQKIDGNHDVVAENLDVVRYELMHLQRLEDFIQKHYDETNPGQYDVDVRLACQMLTPVLLQGVRVYQWKMDSDTSNLSDWRIGNVSNPIFDTYVSNGWYARDLITISNEKGNNFYKVNFPESEGFNMLFTINGSHESRSLEVLVVGFTWGEIANEGIAIHAPKVLALLQLPESTRNRCLDSNDSRINPYGKKTFTYE